MKKSYLITILLFLSTACKKQLEVSAPSYTKNEITVYTSDESACSVLAGIYIKLSAGNAWSLSLYPGLSADEFIPYSSIPNLITPIAYYKNDLNSNNTGDYDYWSIFYPIIYYANSAITGLTRSTLLSENVRKQLLGEAKFIRAFCYFYLVNLYGTVPLVLDTDFETNTAMARTNEADVWVQVINDLKESSELLSADFLDGKVTRVTEERVRPTKWAAEALLARAYLYRKDYVNAEKVSNEIIAQTARFSLTALGDVFLKNSKEAIWQIQPVSYGQNTQDARWFIIPATGFNGGHPFYMNPALANSFESGDLRKDSWIGNVTLGGTKYYYPHKYKINEFNQPLDEYTMVLRLSEQYLIRSEARIQQNNIPGGVEDINIIRERASIEAAPGTSQLSPISSSISKSEAISALMHERRTELFTEWGHRWLDIKRSENVDRIMSSITTAKGTTWNNYAQFYPIKGSELEKAPNVKQTPGYK